MCKNLVEIRFKVFDYAMFKRCSTLIKNLRFLNLCKGQICLHRSLDAKLFRVLLCSVGVEGFSQAGLLSIIY